MSGHEWAPEPGELRGDDRPLSPAAGPIPGSAPPDPDAPVRPVDIDEDDSGPDDAGDDAPEVRRRPGFRIRLPRFRARRDDDGLAEEGEVEVIVGADALDPDADPGQSGEDDGTTGPRRRLAFRLALPRFRRARAETEVDGADEADEPPPPGPGEDDEAPAPARRFPAFGLGREARIGLAAALSFAILVTVWITNKGRALPPPMQIPGKGDVPARSEKDSKGDLARADSPGSPKPDAETTGPAPAADGAGKGPTPDPDCAPGGIGSIARREGGDTPVLPTAAPGPNDPVAPTNSAEFPPAAPAPFASAIPPASPDPTSPPPSAGPAAPAPADAGSAVELPPATSLDPMPASAPTVEPQPADPPSGPSTMPSPPGEPRSDPPALPSTDPAPTPTEPSPLPSDPAPSPGDPAPPATDPAPMPTEPAPPATGAVEPTPAPSVKNEPPPPSVAPEPGPAPVGMPAPSAEPQPASPVPSGKVPPLDPVTPRSAAPGADTPAMRASPGGAGTSSDLGDDWVTIKPGGRRVVVSTPSADGIGLAAASGALGGAAAASIADGPAPREDVAARDQVEPSLHRVRSGENFWTISRLYYGTGRYYRALHAANKREVSDIRELYVGTVIRVPPPETLDRSLVDPPSRERAADRPSGATVSRTSNPGDSDGGADLAVPTLPRPRRRPEVEAPEEPPARPVYKVRGTHETLRGIARDTLDSPKRYREILNLNRDILDENTVLTPGQAITLPADAVIGRRGR